MNISILKQQNQQLFKCLQNKNSEQLVSVIPITNNPVSNNRLSNQSTNFRKTLSNIDLVIDDLDDNNDTLYETPFVSFMNHSSDDINTTPTANNQKYQPRASLIAHGLLTQGVLDASSNSQADLTPTVQANNKNNDTLCRARNLEKK